ncbi:flagellin [Methylorubrum sp. SB2]|uniref:flagellin N-terminal helical domain-containing protein n=1 Tax=Methylorubrum subtropicum TaxID=3138812 RepID=UPI00313BFA96
MTSLLTNIAAMTALTTLKGINNQLDATSNRVSTGQRVSSAADNAAYWSIATTVRTDNASLSAVKDSLGLGSSAIDTAYNGLNSVLSDLQNLRAKLQTALQPGVDRAKVQVEIDAIQDKMRATADSSTASGQNWLSINSGTASYQPSRSLVAGFSRDTAGTVRVSTVDIPVSRIALYDANTSATAATPATTARLTGAQALAGSYDFSTNQEVSFAIKSWADGWGTRTTDIVLNRATLTSAAADLTKVTRGELVDAINNQLAAVSGASGEDPLARASLDADNRLVVETVASPVFPAGGTTRRLRITNEVVTANTQVRTDIGFGTNSGYGPDNIALTGDDDAVRPVLFAFGSNASTTTVKGVLDTIEGTTGMSIQSIDLKQVGSGTAADATVRLLVTQVEKAIARVTDAGTTLGAGKTQIDGQKTFVDSLIKVNERTIGILVDADIEEESVKLKALQTQQQLAVQALSIANGASQSLLSLFR